ncbi:MAG: ABC transporter permease [Mycobacteriales bacterium]|nr:MAG: ABC transporter [Pseudonocardiales bacterium]
MAALSATNVGRSFGYWALQYRRTWRGTVISSVVNPVLFLAAMGVGLGSLVNRHGHHASLGGVGYLQYLAPGLLAATCMQIGTGESTFPVMVSIKWTKNYFAMLATPIGALDVFVGHLAWIGVRIATTGAVFLVVMTVFGGAESAWVLLALPAAILTGLAFAAPVMAFAARLERDSGLAGLNRFVIVPMFLFSGTFFPISQLPIGLHYLAYATPLWHGVDLCRGLALGTATPGMALVHVAYLLAWVVGGCIAGGRVFRRRLVV